MWRWQKGNGCASSEKVGLFVHDMRRGLVDFSVKNSNKNIDLCSFFQIVDDLKKDFTAPELNLAKKVNAS